MHVPTDIADRAEALLAQPVADAGYSLLLCEYSGRVLWVYIERPDGTPVSIGDCVAVHDAITDLLDAEDLVPVSYDLRVSSPGVERPLRRAAHFEQHIGAPVKVRSYEPIGERRNWKGTLVAVEGDLITVRDSGEEHRIPLPAIERAHLVYVPPAKGQKKGGSRRRKRNAGK